MESVEGRVIIKGKIYTDNYSEASINAKGRREQEEVVIAKGTTGECKMSLQLDFSEEGLDNNLLPPSPGTWANNSSVLYAPTYEVWFKINRKGMMHENYEICIPIKVGTMNSSESPIDIDDIDLPAAPTPAELY